MQALLARIVVLAISFLIVSAMMDSVTVNGGITGALGLAVLYGLVSGVIGTVLRLLSLPLIILTVGLFEIVINAFLLLFTAWMTDWLEIDGFFSALGAAVILAVTSMLVGLVMSALLPGTRRS